MTTKELYEIYRQYPTICTDTRKAEKDSIFFALKGENFNGNKFAADALDKGCTYAVIDEKEFDQGEKFILVEDVLRSLQNLSTYHRQQLDIPFIGLTGSNGKTTTKELIKSVLSEKYNCFATHGNLNNHIGVPLSLLSINDEHEIAVIEMGANHQGEIAMLSNIALPDFGLITNVGKAHMEGMGGIKGVIKTKTELYRHLLEHNGKVFVNADNEILMSHSEKLEHYTYGTTKRADIVGELISSNPFIELKWNKSEKWEEKKHSIKTKLPGAYNFENILAAIAIGSYFEVPANAINRGIEEYVSKNNRSQVVKQTSNTIYLDAYNANPSSVEAALRSFEQTAAGKKCVILGEMLEVGDSSAQEHKAVLDKLKDLEFQGNFLVGKAYCNWQDEYNFQFFNDVNSLIQYLKENPIKNSTVLIKGSRKNSLEKLMDEVF